MSVYQDALYVFNKLNYAFNFMTILGSLLSFIIFSRKSFEKSSIAVYCKALAVFDLFIIFNLVFGLVEIITTIYLPLDHDFLCRLINFVTIGISPIPGWILVAFSFDQLIIVSRTERFQFFKKRWFQYSLILGIAIFHCAIYSPAWILSGVVQVSDQNGTISLCLSDSIPMSILYLVESSIVPIVFIVISTGLIIRALIKSRKKISSSDSATTTRKHRIRDFKFAMNSIILNTLFVVVIIPLFFSFILPLDYPTFNMLNSVAFTLFYMNFALHFWVHLSFNSVFRREFLLLFRIIKID